MILQPSQSVRSGFLEANVTISWSFLTNYAQVLICVSRWPESTGLEIAQTIGITERATRRILADLQAGDYIQREKIGRRNRYRVDVHRPLGRIAGERELTVGQLLEFLLERPDPGAVEDGQATQVG